MQYLLLFFNYCNLFNDISYYCGASFLSTLQHRHTHTHARAHAHTRTDRDEHRVVLSKLGDVFVSSADFGLIQRPEAAHDPHPVLRRVHRVHCEALFTVERPAGAQTQVRGPCGGTSMSSE